jgi:hypothetical protein
VIEFLWAGIVIGIPAFALACLEANMQRHRERGWRDAE